MYLAKKVNYFILHLCFGISLFVVANKILTWLAAGKQFCVFLYLQAMTDGCILGCIFKAAIP